MAPVSPVIPCDFRFGKADGTRCQAIASHPIHHGVNDGPDAAHDFVAYARSVDDLDLFPKPAEPRPGAAPARKCVHPRDQRRIVEDGVVCGRCGREMDPALSVRGRNNRSRGNRDELVVARLLGGRKVGPLGGPHDVEVEGYMRLQCKRLDRWPSLARVLTWLDAMQPHDDVRGVTVADTPGPGGRTRRLLIVDLDEFARWHGGQP